MSKQAVLDQIAELGLIAVIRGPSEALTLDMVAALAAGGVKAIEITYTTPNAEAVVAALARRFGGSLLLGMGTLTHADQAASAHAAGARFLVSPVCEPDLVAAMTATGLATMAGALTPTEVLRAYRWGSDVVKVFPGSLTGPSYIKALKGPFPDIPMMPTGGVSAENVKAWFDAGVVAVGAGSELCPPQLARDGRFDEITARAAAFVRVVNESRTR